MLLFKYSFNDLRSICTEHMNVWCCCCYIVKLLLLLQSVINMTFSKECNTLYYLIRSVSSITAFDFYTIVRITESNMTQGQLEALALTHSGTH